MNSVELIESGVALASELASDGNGEGSQTVCNLTMAIDSLTRWEWLQRGRGHALCRGVLGAGEVVR